jgi:hypothetical protein
MSLEDQRLGEFRIPVLAVFLAVAVSLHGISPAAESTPAGAAGAAAPKPAESVENWFEMVDRSQQENFQKQVAQPFEAALADLRARYLASLDAAVAKASAASRLEEALAYRTERQTFEKSQQVAPDDATTPVAVKPLRATFRQQLARLELDRLNKAKALFAEYDAVLAKNQSLLTQHQRLDDALLLKTKRDEIARAWIGPEPLATAAAAPGPGSARPVSAASTVTATRDLPFVNTLGMKFVPVPGIQGLVSVWDTRVQDYAAYAKVKTVDDSWTKQQKDDVPVSREPDYPVVGVSWNDAQEFCQWLTGKESAEGKLPKGMKYRLPTDEEWSRASGLPPERGATPAEKSDKIKEYPWGQGFPPKKSNVGNFADAAWHAKYPKDGWLEGYSDGYLTTSPVGTFPANTFGLYDMGGNVWQWVEDWFNREQKERVFRGASWGNHGRDNLLLSRREQHTPDTRGNYIGFRCILGAPGRQ